MLPEEAVIRDRGHRMPWVPKGVLLAITLMPTFAHADGCADAARAIAEGTGATIGRRTAGSDVYVRLDHPDGRDLALHCKGPDPRRGPHVFVAHPSLRPPPAFYTLAASAASALLQLRAPPMQAAARRCLAAAVRDGTESGTVETKELRVECTANRTAGGVTLTIGSAMMRPY